MKAAALTMVYRDHWYLKLWVNYYGKHLGRQNLFVISHHDEPDIRKIAEGCNIIPYGRENMRKFDIKRWKFINRVQQLLQEGYDCVITGDVDEILFTTEASDNLVEVLEQYSECGAVFAAGFNLVERLGVDDEMDDAKPVLSQRRIGVWSAGYTKAAPAYEPIAYSPGGHRWRRPGTTADYHQARDLLLAHLKFADSRQFAERDEIRKVIVEAPVTEYSIRRNNPWREATVEGHPLALVDDPEPAEFEGSHARFLDFLSKPKIKGDHATVGPRRNPAFETFTLPSEFADRF